MLGTGSEVVRSFLLGTMCCGVVWNDVGKDIPGTERLGTVVRRDEGSNSGQTEKTLGMMS